MEQIPPREKPDRLSAGRRYCLHLERFPERENEGRLERVLKAFLRRILPCRPQRRKRA
jgi:hypothetical protein